MMFSWNAILFRGDEVFFSFEDRILLFRKLRNNLYIILYSRGEFRSVGMGGGGRCPTDIRIGSQPEFILLI